MIAREMSQLHSRRYLNRATSQFLTSHVVNPEIKSLTLVNLSMIVNMKSNFS